MIEGRIAVVTGSNKGIGFFIALQLATSGLFSNILLGCRDQVRGQKAVNEIQQELSKIASFDTQQTKTTSVSYLPLTVGDSESHKQFRQEIEDKFGKIDVLVNNAAIAFKGSDPTPFKEQTKPTLDINFRGTVDLTQNLLPLVRKGSDPRIVNVASMAGRISQVKSAELRQKFQSPSLSMNELSSLVNKFESDVQDGTHKQNGWGSSNYGFSKLALISATKIWAREEASSGIKVNCCCPGYCSTDMSSHRGPRSPSDGARNAVIPATMERSECPTGEFFENYEVGKW